MFDILISWVAAASALLCLACYAASVILRERPRTGRATTSRTLVITTAIVAACAITLFILRVVELS